MKALVIGTTGNAAHDEAVADMITKGYEDAGGIITIGDIAVRSSNSLDFQGGFDYCKAFNAPMMVCSYTGASNRIQIAQDNYPDVTLVMPAGSNTPGSMVFNKTIPQVLISTGGGDVANETGINIEFFDNDYTTAETTPDEQDLSSFSNGYIAGKLLYIMDARHCSSWEARYCARMTGSEGGVWNNNNGYGIINVANAIAYNGSIPTDPFGDPMDIDFSSTKTEIAPGEEYTLSWNVTNAVSQTLDSIPVEAIDNITLTGQTTKTHTIEASNGYTTITKSITVRVEKIKYNLINGKTYIKINFDEPYTGKIYRDDNLIATVSNVTEYYDTTVARKQDLIKYSIWDNIKEIRHNILKTYQGVIT
jgi:hypothetical protein